MTNVTLWSGRRGADWIADPKTWPVTEPAETWAPLERAMVITFVVLVGTLTLEWISFGGFLGGNLKPFHLASVVLLGLMGLRYSLLEVVAPILQRHALIFLVWWMYLVLAIGFAVIHVFPYVEPKETIRSVTYAVVGLFVAAFFAENIHRAQVRRILLWTGLGASVVLGIGLTLSLSGKGTNPLALVGESISKGDPDIISRQLLQEAFQSEEEYSEASASLRHKMVSALLLGLYVSLLCASPLLLRTVRRRVLFWGMIGLGLTSVVLSLSRSISLALFLAMIIAAVRTVLRGRARPGQAAALGLGLAVVVAVAASPVGSLLWVRYVEDSGSYSGRVEASTTFFDNAGDSLWMGAERDAILGSPHNAILDAWLSAGILGGLMVFTMVLTFALIWARELRRYLFSEPGWELPVRHFWVVAIGITPIVRVFTASSGFHLAEWAAVGVFLGCLEANRRILRARALERGTAAPTRSRFARRPGPGWAPSG